LTKHSKYETLEDGMAIRMEAGDSVKLACCDCGLVHWMEAKVEDDGSVLVGFKVDNRATGQLRRHGFGNLLVVHASNLKDTNGG
jgi:hypothetical protein